MTSPTAAVGIDLGTTFSVIAHVDARGQPNTMINAEGELQAATKLGEAAAIIERNPSALQLRYLQTLNDISAENASTIVFPVPIELFNWLKGKSQE